MTAEIQVWYTLGPIKIDKSVPENDLLIRIRRPENDLPSCLEEDVEKNWEDASTREELIDKEILYLTSPPQEEGEKIIIETNARKFRYAKAFNRNPNFYERTYELNKYKLLHACTHCHLRTIDNMLIFGIKKNQFNQISGFGGFPNVKEESIKIGEESYLDIHKTLYNRLKPEIGDLVDNIENMEAVGMTYVDNPLLRGIDIDFLLEVNETSDNIQKSFEESIQFERKLFPVEFRPESIVNFIKEIYSQELKMSPYALGCIVAETERKYNWEEANKILNIIEKIGIDISTSNETDYFSI